MSIELDKADRRVLFELDLNARASASEIARKLRMSQDAVNYRIKRLVDGGAVFKFLTLTDTAKLGYTTHKIFFRFQNATEEKENKILEFIARHPNTQMSCAAEGMFDANVNVLASGPPELSKILGDFNNAFGKYVAERQVLTMVDALFFPREYFVANERTRLRKPVGFGSEPRPVELDNENKAILSMLCKDARTPLVEMAEKTGLSADAVAQRMRKLEAAGVIQNYLLAPNCPAIGLEWHYLLLKFSSFDEKRLRALRGFCEREASIWWMAHTIGAWDALIAIDVWDHGQLRRALSEIKRGFSDVVREYSTVFLPRLVHWNFYPFKTSSPLRAGRRG